VRRCDGRAARCGGGRLGRLGRVRERGGACTDLWRYERSRILDVSASGERLRRRSELLAWRTISSSGTDIPSLVMDPPDVVCFHVTSPEPTRRPGWIAACCALFLTLVGVLALAAVGLVWAVGWLIGRVWTTAGAVKMAVGKVVFSAMVDGVDQLSGHHEPASAQSGVVIHTVESSPVIHAPPAVVFPRIPRTPSPTAPAQPSKAHQIGDAKAVRQCRPDRPRRRPRTA
jgi:hypothetical protein